VEGKRQNDAILKSANSIHDALTSWIRVLLAVLEENGTKQEEASGQMSVLVGAMENVSKNFPPPIVSLATIFLLKRSLEGLTTADELAQRTTKALAPLEDALVAALKDEGWRREDVTARMSALSLELNELTKQSSPLISALTFAFILDQYAEHLSHGNPTSPGGSSAHPSSAEPSEFGNVMGRESVKNGAALGRTLFLGHGTHKAELSVCVFETNEQMKSQGFDLYCSDPMRKSPMEDDSNLSRHTRAAGIGFAVYCVMLFADFFTKEPNREAFIRSVGQTMRAELDRLDGGVTVDLVLHYNRVPIVTDLTKRPLLNMENPGTDDILAVMLNEIGKQVRSPSLAFQRRGIMGFDVIAIPLVKETGAGIMQAVKEFGW
jgi:hypothetical protein